MTRESISSIIIEPTLPHQMTIIWLHGLGADGHDFARLVPELKFSKALGIRYIFPHAPVRPITLNGGYPMRGWYDIVTLDREKFVHDEKGLSESIKAVEHLIQKEQDQGIRADQIVLAGFSQGGAVALATALQQAEPLGGVLALSTYLPAYPGFEKTLTPQSRKTPIAFYHGSLDQVIPLSFAERSIQFLKSEGYQMDDRIYPMEHSLCYQEILDIVAFFEALMTKPHQSPPHSDQVCSSR